jgi:BirA family transcriptional regulator, biotin operon repressor / biotin---[acetyl-CoA-carboxylase] ligase
MRPDLLDSWEGRPIEAWRRKWEVPGFEAHGTIGSTNDRIRELAGMGAEAFTVVVAETQSAGRGRGGQRWWSPAGGLWASLLLRFEPKPTEGPPKRAAGRSGAELGLLPVLVGLALVRTVRDVCGLETTLKWPNDLLIEDRKVAGILCERQERGVVAVGVGINVARTPAPVPFALVDTLGALSEWSAEPPSRAALLGTLVGHIRALLPIPRRLSGDLLDELAEVDALRGRSVESSTGVSGVARGIASDGSLQILQDGGMVSIRAGSVRLLGISTVTRLE